MGKKLPPDQIELYKRIDDILFYEWDPIGVSEIEEARDEYHSYLPRVFKMALEHEEPYGIAKYLTEVTTSSMGLGACSDHDLKIAKQILSFKKQCLKK